MAGGILTFLFSAVVGGLAWLAIGTRLRLHPTDSINQWLNLGAYSLIALPLVFVLVFFLIEAI